MIRSPRWLYPSLLAGSLAWGGCGGATTETAPTTEQATATTRADVQPSTDGAKAPARDVTPVQVIDPTKLEDVVRAEVQGGEATEGPSPLPYLWQAARTAPEPDEPLEVEVPEGLNPLTPVVVVPVGNPMTKAKYELGKQLYFDPRISKNGTISCATCHNPEKGWTDRMPSSIGIHGQVGDRSAPTVINTAYGRSMFWDGRAPSLEGQSQGPPQNKIEMGDQTFEEIVTRLRAIDGYREQFLKVFGTEVTIDGMAKAIATFERTILSGNSAYDKYQAGDHDALNESQKRGMVLFGLRLDRDDPFKAEGVTLKKAECTSCHVGFNFTDELYHNLGAGYDAEKNTFNDLGRWAVTPIGAKYDGDIGAFKTPTLRDIEHTAPYMHDGSEQTLEEVVEFYDRGGNKNPYLDKDMKALNLTDQEKADVVAFMKALSGDPIQVELPTLPSGPDGTSPDPRAAFTPPAPQEAIADPHAVVR